MAQLQLDGLRNAQPYEQLLVALNARLNPGIGLPWREVPAIREVSLDALRDSHNAFWQAPAIEVLVHGNFTYRGTTA